MKNLCKNCKKNLIDFSRSKVYCSLCLDKKKERQSKYYYKNKENIAKKQKEYANKTKDRKRIYDKQRREKNKEKIHKQIKEWHDKNKDKMIQYRKEYREKKKETIRKTKQKCWYARHDHYLQRSKNWRKNNLERSNELLKVSAHRRRANIKGNGGSFTPEEWKELKARYNNQCVCCGKSGIKLEVDHIIPISKGGTSNIINIQPLCRSCNAKKYSKVMNYRLQYDMVEDWT